MYYYAYGNGDSGKSMIYPYTVALSTYLEYQLNNDHIWKDLITEGALRRKDLDSYLKNQKGGYGLNKWLTNFSIAMLGNLDGEGKLDGTLFDFGDSKMAQDIERHLSQVSAKNPSIFTSAAALVSQNNMYGGGIANVYRADLDRAFNLEGVGENISWALRNSDGEIVYVDYGSSNKVSYGEVTGISLDRSDFNMKVGDEATILAEVSGDGIYRDDVIWTVSGDSVICYEGEALAITPGTSIITAKAGADWDKNASITITVEDEEGGDSKDTDKPGESEERKDTDRADGSDAAKAAVTSISLSFNEMKVMVGSSTQLMANVNGMGDFERGVKWSKASGVTCFDISEDGLLKALSKGSGYVTATAAGDSSKSVSANIIVDDGFVYLDNVAIGSGSFEISYDPSKIVYTGKSVKKDVLKNLIIKDKSSGQTVTLKKLAMKKGKKVADGALITKIGLTGQKMTKLSKPIKVEITPFTVTELLDRSRVEKKVKISLNGKKVTLKQSKGDYSLDTAAKKIKFAGNFRGELSY